jgi:hypothetical protein
MPAKKFTTKMIVTETRPLHTGRTKSGEEYQIHQIIATKPDGTVIPQSLNLRSFEDLPRNTVIEVEAELFESEKYGNSYTLKQKGGGGGSGTLAQQVKALEQRIAHIEAFLQGRGEFVGTAAPAQAPAAQPAPVQQQAAPPPPPPPVPPPADVPADQGPPKGGLPSDDDIPF